METHRPGLQRAAFTLIELLTVIAIIGVLASLLMTALLSARKRSRATVCTFNLHQISLAVNMYLDDFARRPTIGELVQHKFLTSPRSLLCPEDKAGNWGGLVVASAPPPGNPPTTAPSTDGPAGSPPYSYLLHPLSWDLPAWNRLMQAGSTAGFAACQLHGLGSQEIPDVRGYSGLLLRAQRDGAVVRRQVFWETALKTDLPASLDTRGDPNGIAFTSQNAAGGGEAALVFRNPIIRLFADDPSLWTTQPDPAPAPNP